MRLDMVIEGVYGCACVSASLSERDVKLRHIGLAFLG
jgi:hypothetical protein